MQGRLSARQLVVAVGLALGVSNPTLPLAPGICAVVVGTLLPAIAAADDVASLIVTVNELYRAQKYSEAIPIAQQALTLGEQALGPDHPRVAILQQNLGLLYIKQQRYSDGEPFLKRALVIVEKALGPDHLQSASALVQLSDLYEKQGRYAEAKPLAERALDIREKTLGPDSPDVASSLTRLAIIYGNQTRYADAERLYRRSISIYEKALGPDDRSVADTLHNLANLFADLGRYGEAESGYQRAIAIYEKVLGPDHADIADSLDSLANAYSEQGKYAIAEPLYLRSLAIREKALGPDHSDIGNSLNNLAELYRREGRYAEAVPLSERSAMVSEKALGPDHPKVAIALGNLGSLYAIVGRHSDAERSKKRALEIREKILGPDHPQVADSLHSLAILYYDKGQYSDAERLLKRSLSIREKALGPWHPDVAISMDSLATLLVERRQQYRQAETLLRKSLEIRERAFGAEDRNVASSIESLAKLYSRQGRYEYSEPLYQRSRGIFEKVLGPDHPRLADTLSNIAHEHETRGRYAEAEPLYLRALKINEKTFGADHSNVSLPLNKLVGLYLKEGRFSEGLPFTRRVVALGKAWETPVLSFLLNAQGQSIISQAEAMDHALSIAQRANQTSVAAAVGKLAVRLAAGGDRLAELIRKDQDLAREAERLDRKIVSMVTEPAAKRSTEAESQTRTRISDVETEREALQKAITSGFPAYAALSNPRPLTLRETQLLLSVDEALVLFAAGGTNSTYVLAINRDRFDWTEIPLSPTALSKKVAAFRRGLDLNQITNPADPSNASRLFDLNFANDLYSGLFGSIEPLIKDKKELLVVPTGALSALPFHLLVTEKPAAAVPADLGGYREAAWLIKRQAVTVLPSLQSLKVLREIGNKGRAGKPLVGFGDPVFRPGVRPLAEARAVAVRNLNTRAYTEFWRGAAIDREMLSQSLSELPDTADELKSIARKLGAPSADIHLSLDASEATVKQLPLSDYRVVYFATHALVAGDIKGVAEPSLVLSLPSSPTELDDGLLTASEVAELKLNADWVVLSACNTIAGDRPGAEALSGLARSFFYAGAKSLLVSHWAVESSAATRLTTSTFEILKSNSKLPRAEALRRAMLNYLNDRSRAENAYPAFWGPFALIGENGPL
ncbi:hypothetical protein CO669_16250 [Bradyrhizobium sp. Y36]|uniref:CHAT domain-containing tetratricopeptide repeat protein n=1 Tax=Bradyrhizobium sp. Y36 TaxID=2035447 RepID=UPI000BEAE3DF|nr:tetratricopeptide repeat protein [Bradyrhizobium sp. Y36]PDT89121.1 hypothetical protein CO669_16250 [Bradyrhizobium sp. Y36]